MKLKNLHIDSYRHLQNIDFDFTYPEGHKKAGEPLEKICIIGQSATGKTSILELIKNNLSQLNSLEVTQGNLFWHSYQLGFNGKIEYIQGNESIKVLEDKIVIRDTEYHNFYGTSMAGTVGKLIPEGLKLMYLSADLISKNTINLFNQNPINILESLSNEKRVEAFDTINNPNYFFEFVQDVDANFWFSIIFKILDYRKKFTQMASDLISKGAIADVNKLTKEFKKWSETNKNPIEKFAEPFNSILSRLNLEIDLTNTEFSIPIKSKSSDEIIAFSELSTGTKSLLLSMFPLFELDTKNAIILIDEPERSLFPDIQIDLINHYQRLAPEAQFIVATHSPFIAAAFEPEERFVLYFDENGEVDVRRGTSPIGDDPNDILSNDFNVDYYNEFGKQAYQKYIDLKTKVAQEKDLNKKKELVVEMAELGDKYNF